MHTIIDDGFSGVGCTGVFFIDGGFIDGGVLRETTSAADGMRGLDCSLRLPPQLRQKLMPGGFSVLHAGQVGPPVMPDLLFVGCGTGGGGPCDTGNPEAPEGVLPVAPLPAFNRVPQLRQKMDPEGLSRLQLEQLGIGPGQGFASRGAYC